MITITDPARKYILNLLIELDKSVLFFGLQGGGCAGFEYSWEPLTDGEYKFYGDEEADQKISLDNNHLVIVDSSMLDKLDNSVIDFKKDITGSQLTVDNPNAKGGCGCGTSISL